MTTTFIESLCAWSKPKHGIRTKRGTRSLRVAVPTPTFWAAWRSEKAQLQAAGITCKPLDNKEWEAQWWQDDVASHSLTERQLNSMPKAGQESDEQATARPSRDTMPVAGEPDALGLRSRGETSQQAGRSTTSEDALGAISEQPSGVVAAVVPAAAPSAGQPGTIPAGITLSAEQLAIKDWFATGTGNLVVKARAGTGKTFTITISLTDAPEQEIAYLVYNTKNRKEAQSKINDPRVTIATHNAFGYRFCRQVWSGCKPDDNVEFDRVRAVEQDIHEEALTAVLRIVGFAKNLWVGVPDEQTLAAMAEDKGIFCAVQDENEKDAYPVSKLAKIARAALQHAFDVRDPLNRISFNDQVWLAVSKGWVRPSFDLIVVDETQDMNVPQLVMVQKAIRKAGRVAVVGDDFQCIYTFRGAYPDGMGMMARALNAKVLGLTITRRCPKAVVAQVTHLVPDYKAADDAPEGSVEHTDEANLFNQLKIGDAVLSRANAPLMGMCLALLRKGVPARIEGRDIGQQLLNAIRKLKAKSVPDFLRKLEAWATRQKNRLNVGKNALVKCQAIDDQVETLQALAEGCANIAEIEARILALFKNSDDEGVRPAVVLSSTHKAKGLEWDRVAMLIWTYNKSRQGMTPEQLQEEKNIYYVACTRAKQQLLLVAQGGTPKLNENTDGTKQGQA